MWMIVKELKHAGGSFPLDETLLDNSDTICSFFFYIFFLHIAVMHYQEGAITPE